VKVAYIAGGIDTTQPDFQRNPKYVNAGSPAGPVVTAVNFSGDPTPASGGDAAGESFLDASSIAAQGNTVYDLNNYISSTHSLTHPCDITITGAAPGASVLGLDVFSADYDTTQSNFLQAIDYAVGNGVKVLNESFGSNNFPDTALDVTRIADDDAVAAGVTVVVSSGDAGVGNTLGSPSTDPNLISAGATTTFRAYQQDFYGGINASIPNATDGNWIDNNISSISSSGFSMSGANTVDIVAPGDLNWALCSVDVAVFPGCTNENGAASPIQITGGTSESAPLTAAAAADVIQAYASTHGGADPSPALVKQILMSTATDIGAPAEEQGAGLLNVLAAVKEAISITGTSGTPQGGLLVSPNQINIVQAPGASTSRQIYVGNTGSSAVTVDLSTRALDRQVGPVVTGSFCLNPSSTTSSCGPPTTNTMQIWSGVTEVYQEETFTVPTMSHPSRLEFSADYPYTGQNSLLHVSLYDPDGNYAGYSLPQGLADFAHIEVANPLAGTWTAVFFTEQDGATKGGVGTSGTIQWSATSTEFEPYGTISPSTLVIAPGTAGVATFTALSPAASGDTARSIVLSTVGGGTTTIPVTIRTIVPTGPNGGNFTGVLTGGNGRGNPSNMNSYVFSVPRGLRDLDVSAAFGDPNDAVVAFLLDPEGEAVASSSSVTADSTQTSIISTGDVNVYKDAPQAGTWTLVLDWLTPVSGQELSEAFSGAIRYNEVSVTSNLPRSPFSPQAFFVDPRRSGSASVRLADINGSDQGMSLPLPPGLAFPVYIVPTDTTGITANLTSTVPVSFDTEPFTGDPDLAPSVPAPGVRESQGADSASLTYTSPAGEVMPGFWYLNPTEIGPYGPTGEPSATANASFSATTEPFDPAVTSSTGDLWSAYNGLSTGFSPVYVEPGKSATITVTIKPTAPPGTLVSGFINVDDTFQVNELVGTTYTGGDELAAIPYSYKVFSPLQGYDLAGRDGGVFHFGYGHWWGSAAGLGSSPFVSIVPTVDHDGYYMVNAAGQVYPFGDALAEGGLSSAPAVPIVAAAADAGGHGYWLVDADGHVSKFGDAVNWGSEDWTALHETVAGMAATPDGLGYWLVTTNGDVLAYGDAHGYGSPKASRLQLAAPLVGIATTPGGRGYYLVGSDGGVFAYGDAKFHGSMYGRHLNGAAVAIATPQTGSGYWIFAADGGVFTFGTAKFFGSLGASSVSTRTSGASANS
jgi:hypothetical protein